MTATAYVHGKAIEVDAPPGADAFTLRVAAAVQKPDEIPILFPDGHPLARRNRRLGALGIDSVAELAKLEGIIDASGVLAGVAAHSTPLRVAFRDYLEGLAA